MSLNGVFSTLLAAVLLLAGTRSVEAGSTATQTVTIEVRAVNEISVSGNPEPLVLSTARPGSRALFARDDSTTYAITTNEANRKITAQMSLPSSPDPAPPGITLTIALQAPRGAESLGEVTLSTTPRDVVTQITEVAQSGLRITYTLSSTIGIPLLSETRLVTLTIAPGT